MGGRGLCPDDGKFERRCPMMLQHTRRAVAAAGGRPGPSANPLSAQAPPPYLRRSRGPPPPAPSTCRHSAQHSPGRLPARRPTD